MKYSIAVYSQFRAISSPDIQINFIQLYRSIIYRRVMHTLSTTSLLNYSSITEEYEISIYRRRANYSV